MSSDSLRCDVSNLATENEQDENGAMKGYVRDIKKGLKEHQAICKTEMGTAFLERSVKFFLLCKPLVSSHSPQKQQQPLHTQQAWLLRNRSYSRGDAAPGP